MAEHTSLDTQPIITLGGLAKHYRQGGEMVRAVDDAFLTVWPGDFLVITGRSGSGKTTLLSLIGGLTTASAGDVHLFGHSVAQMSDDAISQMRAERIGFVFQFASLIPTLTTTDNVRLPGLFARQPVPVEVAWQRLAQVGLDSMRDRYPSQLSGGQQARVAVARALANRPDLLLADEPTGNLDVETEVEILTLLRDLNQASGGQNGHGLREAGLTILLVTHNPELARFGNRHLVMRDGRLQEQPVQARQELLAHG